MITYNAQEKVLTINLHNLEHCGFDHESFDDELFLHGIDDPAARKPRVLIVEFYPDQPYGAEVETEDPATEDDA